MFKNNKENPDISTSKIRITVVNDVTHKRLAVFKTSKFAIITSVIASILLLITLTWLVIFFTPIRESIPGYPSDETKRAYLNNARRADSLEIELKLWSLYLNNLQAIINGDETILIDTIFTRRSVPANYKHTSSTSKEDSLLRDQVLQLELLGRQNSSSQLEGLLFFTPIKGVITEAYNRTTIDHPYLDIAAAENSTVSAILDGTVIFADWSNETGYNIQIQHSNDLVSIYKHNKKLLKAVGDRVSAGTPIGIIGSSAGSISSGSHLHFELWHRGEPVDPAKYIQF